MGECRHATQYWAVAITWLAVAAPSFSNYFAPLLVAMIELSERRLSVPFWLAAARLRHTADTSLDGRAPRRADHPPQG